jgi:hypothetical protein
MEASAKELRSVSSRSGSFSKGSLFNSHEDSPWGNRRLDSLMSILSISSPKISNNETNEYLNDLK